jgi:uncharacterized membrane protein
MTRTQQANLELPAGGTVPRRSVVPWLLTALDVLAIGVLVGLLVGNRLLTAQLAIYGEADMASSSVVLDLMDDFLGPLLISIGAALLLAILTLGSWLIAGIRSAALRTVAIALLIILLVMGVLVFGLGRRSATTPPAPSTPTATPGLSF